MYSGYLTNGSIENRSTWLSTTTDGEVKCLVQISEKNLGALDFNKLLWVWMDPCSKAISKSVYKDSEYTLKINLYNIKPAVN